MTSELLRGSRWQVLAVGLVALGVWGGLVVRTRLTRPDNTSSTHASTQLAGRVHSHAVVTASIQDELLETYRVLVVPLDPVGRTSADRGEVTAPILTGTVTAQGKPVDGALVYAHLAPIGKEHEAEQTYANISRASPVPVGETLTDATGHYRLHLPIRASAYFVDAGVSATGFVPQVVESIEVSPLGRSQDFELSAGLPISGVVVDTSGRPAPGVTLLAAQDPRFDNLDALTSTALLQRKPMRTGGRYSKYFEGESTSREDGSFTLLGLVPGDYMVVSASPEWKWRPVKARAGDADLVLHANHAVGVRIQVCDAATAAPLERFTGKVVLSISSSSGSPARTTKLGAGLDGLLELSWTEQEGWTNLGDFSFEVSAPGYVSSRASSVWPERGIQDLTVALEPEIPGQVELDVKFEDGTPVTEPLIVEYAEPGRGQRRELEVPCASPGRYLAPVPAGRWFLHVRRATDLVRDGWKGELLSDAKLPAQRVVPSVVLSQGATIVLTWSSTLAPPPTWTVIFHSDSGAFSSNRRFLAPQARITGVPPGKWQLSIDAAPVGKWSRDIDVLDRRSTELTIP